MKKRGLSPVIATVLLIAIALILAIIIFFWAKNFLGDAVEKEGRRIQDSCQDVDFNVEAYSSQIYISNQGNVPIYGIEVRKKSIGTSKIIKSSNLGKGTVNIGETDSLDISGLITSGDLSIGDNILVVPILLGESGSKKKTYICDKDYGQETVIEN